MTSLSHEKRWNIVITLTVLATALILVLVMTRITSTEEVTYPKATGDLSIIETWSEKEVYSFLDDLGCFDIPYGEEFESKFPEEVGFCRKVRNIWTEKYDKNKESNVNWELYHSLDKGGE